MDETGTSLNATLAEQKRGTTNSNIKNNFSAQHVQTEYKSTGTLLNALHTVLIITNGSYWKLVH